MNDDDQLATAETIIHALSQFGAEQEEQHASNQLDQYSTLLSNQEVSDQHDLGGLTRGELEAEVLKLRGLVYQESASASPGDNIPPVKRRRRDGVKAALTVKHKVDGQTGKRVERGRKTELYKAIRQTMRVHMEMDKEADPLPAPMLAASSSADHPVWIVPDWQAPVGDGANARWMESIASALSQTLQSESNPHQKVEEDDKDLPTILEAVKVTFANYVKRYKSENDSTHAERKARYAKNRRRWARKDLKQEKRSKARSHLEPAHPYTSLPQSALLFNYQSSEYSSPGSDSSDSDDDFHQEKVRKRKALWEGMRNAEAGPSGTGKEYGWGMGLGMKVLEVRTPSWRSEKLNEYYAHLDSLSELHAQNRNTPRSQPRPTASSIKAGHVAPSHRRFTLPPEIRRKGKQRSGKGKKRKNGEGDEGDAEDEGEGWMWATAKVGIWPTRSKTLVEGGAVEIEDGGMTLIS